MERPMPSGKRIYYRGCQTGFTYMGLMMVIAISGIAMAGVGIVWQQDMQREREKELLFIGDEYRLAIGNYYENSPGGLKQYPATLQDLLVDNRGSIIKHHIRKLYLEPFTRDKNWKFIMVGMRISGVYSGSKLIPTKKTGFISPYEIFSEAIDYSDWKFIYTPGSMPSTTENPNPVS